MKNIINGIFYGWWNVATGFVGMGLSYAMFTVFAFGVFVKPLENEFGWTRGELSFAITMTNFAVVIASPCLGLIIDKFGVRRVLIPSVILMGLTVAAMMLLTANLWHFYVLYFLIPLLGAGTLPQSYSRVLIAWFSRTPGHRPGHIPRRFWRRCDAGACFCANDDRKPRLAHGLCRLCRSHLRPGIAPWQYSY